MTRRLLARYPKLRVVLMSATMQTDLYAEYFKSAVGAHEVSETLHVGGARFPVEINHLEEVAELRELPVRLRAAALRLAERTDSIARAGLQHGTDGVSAAVVSMALELAVWVARLAAAERPAAARC